ncbi:CBF-domain-containing protein [Pholiota conissans]|uniref:CBF-domain-containing protein n=1 Tax=Pholiota conissans TaxID=109636 RepID=A0A9P5YUY9_9AGAR|nr:CBF-domain-containing protein [Pholiota conissans]
MARLRKEKGHKKSASVATKSADANLLKGLDVHAVTGTENVDPTLASDVSQFLKDLSLKSSDVPKGKGKASAIGEDGKAKSKGDDAAKTPKKQNKQKKQTGASSTKSEPIPASATEPKRTGEKVALPTKVSFNPKSSFVFQPTSLWYDALPRLAPSDSTAISPAHLSELTAKATELHEADIRTFQQSSTSNSSSSEAGFLAKIIQSGTLSDRLSALTLLVQSSPLHNIKALETLKTMAERGKGKGGREESLKALRCIVDWWVGGGAPGRKLKYFRDQPLLHAGATDAYLLVWYYEDWLKKYFFSILQILETLSLDPLPYVRTQTITLIFTLLRDKPEQEQNLLRLLVNKLGDTEKSLASRASYHLLQLLQSHPAMKGIIVREIISLVLRPVAAPAAPVPPTVVGASTGKHIRFDNAEPSSKPKPKAAPNEKKTTNPHARYYATVTFNQIVLTPADRDIAVHLIDVYFEMFKELLGEGEGEDGAGNEDEGELKEGADEQEFKTDKGGRIREGKTKSKGKGKGRQMEVKGAAGFTEVEDSNSKLISAILTGVNRALPFAKIDANDAGINKHIDTLFLITHTSTFNISLQALVLIQQITSSFTTTAAPASSSTSSATAKSITDRYYRTLYASLYDTRLATSSKQAMYLNLFFKSVKADAGRGDEGRERVKALVRRFVQLLVSAGSGATEFVAGGLFLLGELFSSIPGLRAMVNEPPKATEESYDPRKREPQFAHASALPLWELMPLLHHYHPAVALHARQLLSSQPLTASADLSQNTLSHFLDRFVYKNSKKLKAGEPVGKGASAMQPAASAVEGVKLAKGDLGAEMMVNDPKFLKRKAGDVPVDQLFFHQYFTRKEEREKAKAAKVSKRKEGKESDEEEEEEEEEEEHDESEEEASASEAEADDAVDEDEEDDSDLDEDEIWKVMQATMPKAEGDDDLMEDSDADIDDDDLSLGDSDEDANILDDDEDEDEDVEKINSDDDDDGLSLVEGSDNEDLVSLDGDVPDGLIEYDGSDADDGNPDDEEWGGIGSGAGGAKRKREGESKSERRKKLRSLPTFASYEDYAKMIEDGPEDDI